MYDIIIIGGGPAGMTAAIKAKEACMDAEVLIIDRNKKIGKKLYATGNGKCNLANTELDLSSYHSQNEFFPYQFITVQSSSDVVGFMNELGVRCYTDKGYIYPASLQASTVVWALSDRLKQLGVEVHTSENVVRVESCGTGYEIYTESSNYRTRVLIAAPGGPAAPKLGGTDAMYGILKHMGVNVIKPHPALCKLRCAEDISELTGARSKAVAKLMCEAQEYDRESGEIQFADRYLSGIAIFNLSMQCIDLLLENRSPVIELEFVPHITETELENYIFSFIERNALRRPEAMLNGLVHEKVSRYILERLGIHKNTVSDLLERDKKDICNAVKHMSFSINGYGGYDDSQASCGGIDTRMLRADNLEVDGHRNLFAVGECVDVTGKCGGFNITWAIISGMRAGENAGKRLSDDKNK